MHKILVVDDSWLARRAVLKILNSSGYECQEVSSGKAALEILDKESFECVLLDLLMEDMSGFDVLESLNHKDISVPVIVVSADIQETSKKRCYDLGAFGFLNKPANETDLLDKVKDAIDTALEK